jgi:hypothetical protein
MGLTVSTLLRDSPQRAKVCPQPLSTLARQSFPTAIHTSIGTPILTTVLFGRLSQSSIFTRLSNPFEIRLTSCVLADSRAVSGLIQVL